MKLQMHLQTPLCLSLAIALLSGSSCSVVVGNIKPVEQRSEAYGVMDLSKANSDWLKLDQKKVAADENPGDQELSSTEVADVAYQSRSTASIISLSSACRKGTEMANRDLKGLTNLLLLGLSDTTLRKEQGMEVQKTPALETTVRGKLNREPMMLQTVVLKRETCVYDLVYMARPQFFDRHTEDFSHFVASLKLKE